MTLIRWAAFVAGIVIGVWLLGFAMRLLFVAEPRSLWDVVAGGALLTAMASVAPISIIAVFRPRSSGVALLVASMIIDAAFFVWPLTGGIHLLPPTSHLLAGALLPAAALAWLTSGPSGTASEQRQLRSAARWAAVILAVSLGVFLLRPGIRWVWRAWQWREWLVFFWGLSLFLPLIPVAATALLRARVAACAAFGFAACSGGCALLLSLGPWKGTADAFSRLLMVVGSAAPLATIGALLWYSTTQSKAFPDSGRCPASHA